MRGAEVKDDETEEHTATGENTEDDHRGENSVTLAVQRGSQCEVMSNSFPCVL